MNKVKLIAEVGWNHMGNMDLGRKMIEAAAENGADIVKFQTWSEKKLKPGPWDQDGRREIYYQAQLSEKDHIFLKKTCDENNVEMLTSVFNVDDLDYLSTLGMDMIKIPSHEVHNINLISKASKLFNIILISTGASNWFEVTKILKKVSAEKLILMHCVSAYPCRPENINLPKIQKLFKLTKCVGYSGHYFGIDDALAAICMGATYIEKHFTIDRSLPGRDNRFAILPKELQKMAEFRANYEFMNLDRGIDLQECEMDVYKKYRGRWSSDG